MPNVTPGDLHVNTNLTTVMVGWREQNDDFIADKVFPNVPVDHATDFFYKFGKRAFLQSMAARRAPATETPGVEWTFTRDTFQAEVFGLHADIEDQARANADTNFQLDRASTELVTQQMLLRREKEWMASFFGAGLWVEDYTGVASAPGANQFIQWDQSGSSPITDFRKHRLRFKQRTGLLPNTAVFGAQVWDQLIDHPEILARIQYVQKGFLSEALVAEALGLDNVYVSYALEATDTSEELVADLNPTTQFLAGKGVWIGYANPNPSKLQPSAGYTFSWNGYLGASAFGGRIKKYRMEHIASDRIEMEMAYDMKIVASELGSFWASAVS